MSQSDIHTQMRNRFNNSGAQKYNNNQPTEDSLNKGDWPPSTKERMELSAQNRFDLSGKKRVELKKNALGGDSVGMQPQLQGSELSEPAMHFVSTISPPFLHREIYESTLEGKRDYTDGSKNPGLHKEDNSMASILEQSGPRKLVVINQ